MLQPVSCGVKGCIGLSLSAQYYYLFARNANIIPRVGTNTAQQYTTKGVPPLVVR